MTGTTSEGPPPAPIAARTTAEHAAIADQARGTPGAMRAVGGRGARAGLRLFGVAGVDASVRGPRPPLVPDTDLIVFRDVAAVVEPAAYGAEPLGTVAMERHRGVVEEVFARRAVVPAPPGTVFRSRDALAGWLELHYFTLVEALHFVEDRAVARVAVAWASRAELPTHRAAPLHLGPESPGDGPPESAALLSEASEPFLALRREAVSLLVLRADDVAEPEAAYGSFLVERTRWTLFEQAVAREAELRPALRLRLSGPWPPYDFVQMQFHG